MPDIVPYLWRHYFVVLSEIWVYKSGSLYSAIPNTHNAPEKKCAKYAHLFHFYPMMHSGYHYHRIHSIKMVCTHANTTTLARLFMRTIHGTPIDLQCLLSVIIPAIRHLKCTLYTGKVTREPIQTHCESLMIRKHRCEVTGGWGHSEDGCCVIAPSRLSSASSVRYFWGQTKNGI